jgi:hypothetical protein
MERVWDKKELLRKFGKEQPRAIDVCRVCGKTFGSHWGSACIKSGELLEDTPYLEQSGNEIDSD